MVLPQVSKREHPTVLQLTVSVHARALVFSRSLSYGV
jgi:hypothetical protein